jgi:2-hydroxychromene-2-carboxylate isomerase
MQPNPFPQNSLLAARVATALPADACAHFSRAVFRAQFIHGYPIADREVLASILHEVGAFLPSLAAADTAATKGELRGATDEAQALGIYGAPSFTTRSRELFWGNDRLEEAVAWARNEAAAPPETGFPSR